MHISTLQNTGCRSFNKKKSRLTEMSQKEASQSETLYLLGALRASSLEKRAGNARREDRKLRPRRRFDDLPLIGPNRMPPEINMAA